ncbi:DUF722 domain-containing protein [uncultured Clostridium sp.]|uniref:DUF722 domain-containing protein n=1 Tax=uncultured Clostridium sp. TaxID=59620 RepID=UPI00262028E1|nr:DUF722 domain-containing protein [uncultured Clostridium sp.]
MSIDFKKIENVLYSYNGILTDIKCIEIDIKREEAEYRGCGAIDYSTEGGKSNYFNSTVENEVIERERRMNILKRELLNKQTIKEKIDIILESLSKTERDLVQDRYLSKRPKSWNEISEKIGFSISHCSKTLRKKIISKFEKIV